MKVSLKEIREVFGELIEGKKSREESASWASKRQLANDSDDLEFEPASEKKKIWRSIMYLMGVDLKCKGGEYVHSTENFLDFTKSILAPVVEVPQKDHWIYKDSKAFSSLMTGIKDAEEGKLHDLGSFAQYADEDE